MSLIESYNKYNQKKPVWSFRVDPNLNKALLKLSDKKSKQEFLEELVLEYLKIKGILEVEYKIKD